MQAISAGPLQAIVTPDVPASDVRMNVVLLHGFGAPGTDLVGIEQAIETKVPTRFIYLQAPLVLDGMEGPHAGRAWWYIDMIALQVARMTGAHDQLASQTPEGLTEAREALDRALSALESDLGMRPEDTVLGGFSQGAMLSCDYALRSEKRLRGLIQLSGTVLCEAEWKSLLERKSGLRVLQSHSPDDQVLPYALAERHRDNMRNAGLQVDFVTFRGGHGIAPVVLEKLSAFLASL